MGASVIPGNAQMPDIVSPRRRIGGRDFDLRHQVAIMAIINRTPDSFHDRGRTFALEAAVDAVARAVADGADLVDIGGVPFGIHAGEVTEAEELDRVIPVVRAVAGTTEAAISVDTYRAGVARQALAAGATVINDTSGLHDPELAGLVAAHPSAFIVITHSLASPPRTPVVRPSYRDVVREVADFLIDKVRVALDHGVRPEQIIIDPGHDLNKNTYHSLELCRRLYEITAIGYPTLVALSNKDFIGETLNVPQDQRLEGTIAAGVICVMLGARLIRVHDVRAAVASLRMTEAILGWRPPVTASHNLT